MKRVLEWQGSIHVSRKLRVGTICAWCMAVGNSSGGVVVGGRTEFSEARKPVGGEMGGNGR